jgi:hypothetical protein
VSHSCLSFRTGRQFNNLGAPPCEVWARKMTIKMSVVGQGVTCGAHRRYDRYTSDGCLFALNAEVGSPSLDFHGTRFH